MPVHKDDAVLLLLRVKNVIALYSKNVSDRKIVDALSLFKPGTGGALGTPCNVTIWMENDMIKIEHTTEEPPVRISWANRPDLWLDGSIVIIGTGDMRDLTAESGSVDLSGLLKNDLVIKYRDDYRLEIRCVNPIPLTKTNNNLVYCQ